jgi:MOSC domain-containing protein YiiM
MLARPIARVNPGGPDRGLPGVAIAEGRVRGRPQSRRGRADERDNCGVTTTDCAQADAGLLVSVHVGRPRAVPTNREPVSTAIWKYPVEGRVAVRGVNLDGDDQADRSVHGGRDKAVYAYAEEEVQAWERELGRDLGEAAFGQNLTTRGLPISDAVIGERWRLGSTVLEVAQPRQPCFKLGMRIGEPGFVKRFAHASRPGAYLRIVTEGDIGAGDRIEITSRPDHGITCRMVSDALLRDPALLPVVVKASQLPSNLRAWMLDRIPK